ncbi:MAG: alpha/beta fold hydrolase [Bacillota bacterium]
MTIQEVDNLLTQLYQDRPQALTEFGKNFFASTITTSFRQWFHDLSLQGSGHGTIATARSLRDEDLRHDLGKIQIPSGIFHGLLDRICPYELALQMHKGIRNSQLFRFEKSGHAIFYDELEKFNRQFTDFLQA